MERFAHTRSWRAASLVILLTLNLFGLRVAAEDLERDSLAKWISDCSAPGDNSSALAKVTLDGKRDLSILRDHLGEEIIGLVEKINRRDRKHLDKAEIYVPCSMLPENELSPFPSRLSEFLEVPRILFVSLEVQAFAAYEYGTLVRWGPVSSGHRKQQTPQGLYYTNWKSVRRVSTINSNWIMYWYFNIHSSMGVAFHQYAMPGYPASYGCIRLLRRDAKWIFNWAEEWERNTGTAIPSAYGTPVIVFEQYDYDSVPPWQANSPFQATVTEDEISRVFQKYSRIISKRLKARAALEESEVSPSR